MGKSQTFKSEEDELIIKLHESEGKEKSTIDDNFMVCIHQSVYTEIEKFAVTNTSKELGGFLLGSASKSEENKQFIMVEGFLPAQYTDALKGSVTFTHQTWEDMHVRREQQLPKLKIVGWFHTHPGFGIFLSSYDLFIHQNFFDLSWQVAYVVDPVNNQRGFFHWQEGKIEPCQFMLLENAPDAKGTPILLDQAPKKSWVNKKKAFFVVVGTLAAVTIGLWSYVQMNKFQTGGNSPTQKTEHNISDAISKEKVDYELHYTVRLNDTLSGISYSLFQNPERAEDIAQYNKILNKDMIFPGQVLKVKLDKVISF